ncbi:hypothetical protein CMT41_02115 [Colwellia sp. MT41]|uniref:Uncharacterized protein n=1 Tax=Colwellia marinimaniae TaxID=1513592 RepID=A0ABQ0MZM4_9GAMM|nr:MULTISPECIES: hypothetical protein [Colwellia]ALO33645.1 hypothetical protein CMT41_02115 [Colwellia sp. MT41]GAW97810.1 hypothetical protein MTCD1_03454 [Colwellia marinimaniae]
MSKVINVLATMANDASLITNKEITALLANTDISNEQKQAILALDSERLAETITDFPVSMCSIVVAPEDNEQENQEETNNDEAKNHLNCAVNG